MTNDTRTTSETPESDAYFSSKLRGEHGYYTADADFARSLEKRLREAEADCVRLNNEKMAALFDDDGFPVREKLKRAEAALAVAGSTINDLRVDCAGFARDLARAEAELARMGQVYASACVRVVAMGVPAFGTLDEGLDKLAAALTTAKTIIARCHEAIGENANSDDETLPEVIALHIREGREYLEGEEARIATARREAAEGMREQAAKAARKVSEHEFFHDGLSGDLYDVKDKAHSYVAGWQEASNEVDAEIRALEVK